MHVEAALTLRCCQHLTSVTHNVIKLTLSIASRLLAGYAALQQQLARPDGFLRMNHRNANKFDCLRKLCTVRMLHLLQTSDCTQQLADESCRYVTKALTADGHSTPHLEVQVDAVRVDVDSAAAAMSLNVRLSTPGQKLHQRHAGRSGSLCSR